jgi:DNA-directed RNA polymerase specialized sigma subunit
MGWLAICIGRRVAFASDPSKAARPGFFQSRRIMAKHGKVRKAILRDGKFYDEDGSLVDPKWADSLSEYIGQVFGDEVDRSPDGGEHKEEKLRRRAERLGQGFVFHDDGKSRGDLSNLRIKLRGEPSKEQLQAWFDRERQRDPNITFDEACERWEEQRYTADTAEPGVASDLANYIWDGPLYKVDEEADDIRDARGAITRLTVLYPDAVSRGWWHVRTEITTVQIPMQMGPKLKQLTRRKPEYFEAAFPVLKVQDGLVRVNRVWVARAEDGEIFKAAIEYIEYTKPVDKFMSWVDACQMYCFDKTLAKGAAALDRLARRFRPLVGRIVKEFWGPKELLTSLGMLGLSEAIRSYDFDRNMRFSTYAEVVIRRTMHDALRGSTLAERILYADTNATVEQIAASPEYKNPQEALECAAAAVLKRETEKTKYEAYDVREIGIIDDTDADDSNRARSFVAHGYINEANLQTAVDHHALSRFLDQEAEANEIRIERRVKEIGRREASLEAVERRRSE